MSVVAIPDAFVMGYCSSVSMSEYASVPVINSG